MRTFHGSVVSFLGLFIILACGSGENEGGSGGSANGSGGESSSSGGSTGSGGDNPADGGRSSAGGQQSSGSGGNEGSGPPILPVVPEVEDSCADADTTTTGCLKFHGHFGATPLDVDCSESSYLTVLDSTAWGCLNEEAHLNISTHAGEDTAEFDIDPSVDDDAVIFWLGDEKVDQLSPDFAGMHCKVTWGDILETYLSGTCYGAWGANGDGSYEYEVFASFKL